MGLTERHILFIPSWYPSSDAPLLGNFFQEQASMFAEIGPKVGFLRREEDTALFQIPIEMAPMNVVLPHHNSFIAVSRERMRSASVVHQNSKV